MLRKFLPGLSAAALALTLAPCLQAENWPQWRGLDYNGSSPETGFPTTWQASDAAWKAPMPGSSGATPAVWGDSIFVTSPDAEKNLLLLCLDLPTGKEKWRKVVVEGGNAEKGKGNSASPSPVTDGKAVYVLYSSGDLAAYDFEGKSLWHRKLGEDYGRFAIMWLYGSSPLLFEGKLYVQVLQRTPAPTDYPGIAGAGGPRESYLLAINPADGQTIWKHVRPTDAQVESMESYATPTPHRGLDGKMQLLVVGGDCLSGHNPADGAELWRGFGLNRKKGQFMRVVPSPVSAAGLAIACGPKKEQMLAFRTDLTGDVTETGVAWTFDEKKTPDVCTPAVYQGKLFVLDGDSQTLTCMDPKTGERKWQGNLGDRTTVRASPTVADGKIYIVNEKGTVFVCDTGDEFKILATIPMGDGDTTRSSVVPTQHRLLIRTTQTLFCIGGK